MDEFERLLTPRTKMVAVVHLSNALGTINPVAEIVALARTRRRGGARSTDRRPSYHMPVDVQALGADFYVFTGHKLYGPTGIGVLYGREAVLDAMPPFLGGGDMIRTVTFEGSTWNDLPYKFEAGTPHIAGAIGLGAAIDYVRGDRLRRDRRARGGAARARDARARRRCPACGSSARRAARRASCRS